MKCPKCSYVSHDYLDACRKCGIDLMAFKQDIGLLVLQPGELDLSLVLGEAGANHLFESVREEVTSHPSDDDDFDISLDDYAAQPGIRRAPGAAQRTGGRGSQEDVAGADHLTLELDASALPAAMTAHLRTLQTIPQAPASLPNPDAVPPVAPKASPLPGHVTVEMEPASMFTELPSGIFQETAPAAPPPQAVPETPGAQDITRSLQLDVSHLDFGSMPPSASFTRKTESIDEAGTERADEAGSGAPSSRSIASLQLQDVGLADDMPAAPEAPASKVTVPTLPAIDVVAVETTSAQMDAERRIASEAAEAATNTVANSVAFPVDDSAWALEADELSGSAISDVVEPAFTSLDEPLLEDMDLLPSFEFKLDTLAEADAALSDLTVPTLDEAPRTDVDEDVPRTPPSRALMPTPAELTPEGTLTLSDMLALEELGAPLPAGHLTLEMKAPALPPDLASHLREDATRTPPRDNPETPEASAGADHGFPAAAALIPRDLDDVALPEHLTLELDSSVMSNVSSILLDKLRREDLPADVQSKMSPPGDQGDPEEELILDLDDLKSDNDKPV